MLAFFKFLYDKLGAPWKLLLLLAFTRGTVLTGRFECGVQTINRPPTRRLTVWKRECKSVFDKTVGESKLSKTNGVRSPAVPPHVTAMTTKTIWNVFKSCTGGFVVISDPVGIKFWKNVKYVSISQKLSKNVNFCRIT